MVVLVLSSRFLVTLDIKFSIVLGQFRSFLVPFASWFWLFLVIFGNFQVNLGQFSFLWRPLAFDPFSDILFSPFFAFTSFENKSMKNGSFAVHSISRKNISINLMHWLHYSTTFKKRNRKRRMCFSKHCSLHCILT